MDAPRITFRKGAKTILRPLEKSDVPTLTRWMNDPDVKQYLGRYLPMPESKEKEWLKSMHENENQIVLGIEPKSEERLIGTIGLHKIRYKDGVAASGATIGDKSYRSDGYGTDAKMLQLRYAFEQLNLRKVNARVFAFNKRSIAYLKQCGYRKEGVREQDLFKNGEYVDVVLMAVFKNEWERFWDDYKDNHDL